MRMNIKDAGDIHHLLNSMRNVVTRSRSKQRMSKLIADPQAFRLFKNDVNEIWRFIWQLRDVECEVTVDE